MTFAFPDCTVTSWQKHSDGNWTWRARDGRGFRTFRARWDTPPEVLHRLAKKVLDG